MTEFPLITIGDDTMPWGIDDLIEYLSQYGKVVISRTANNSGWLVRHDTEIDERGYPEGNATRIYFSGWCNRFEFDVYSDSKFITFYRDVKKAVEEYLKLK